MEVTEEQINAIQAGITKFREGYSQMVTAFDTINDIKAAEETFSFSNGYPFEKSFDEIDVSTWLENCQDELDELKSVAQTK